MEIDSILKQVDRLYNENRSVEAEGLLLDSATTALEENDEASLLQLLNELLGFYRETSQYEKGYGIARNALLVAGNLCAPDSEPYATTLLNIATVYRGGGRLEEALDFYHRAEEIYARTQEPGSMLLASLYNNEALLYQETGDFEAARVLLERALAIVTERGEAYEEAVTRANLAGTYLQLGEPETAREEAERSIALFEGQGVEDQHLCAAYSALGSYHYIKGDFETAATIFHNAMGIMERVLGRNAYYERLAENYEASREAMRVKANSVTGLEICRAYYEEYGKPMLEERFGDYLDKIAVGLAGEGSDAFGWDDEFSRDHDWGPSFCLWVTEEVYEQIGEELQKAYDALPEEFRSLRRAQTVQGSGRRGVCTVRGFYQRLLGAPTYEEIDWRGIDDAQLAAAVSGEVWRDDEGSFTALREKLKQGFPEPILYAKLAEGCARFAQSGQYNYDRMLRRGNSLTADILLGDALREAMRLQYLMEGKYPPISKWLYRGLEDLEGGGELTELLQAMKREPAKAEEVGAFLALGMYRRDFLSDIDPYLDHQTEELLEKSLYSAETNEELAMRIARLEFEAFDKVQNEGGRAECQDNWATFSIMRRSQYLTWTRTMLLQYLYDFNRELRLGHNLITEKYGRMMESTAPERYEELKGSFPELTPEKQAIIEQITALQVGWMEEFSAQYPNLGRQARAIRTAQDTDYDTSYETYLRGELGTYSDKMLELYARFVVGLSREGENLARETMENSVKLYGYRSLEHAEEFLGK